MGKREVEMIKVNPIENAGGILKYPSFKQGVQTNYGVIPPKKNFVESRLFTTFTSGIKDFFFGPQIKERAGNIEKNLLTNGKHFDKTV